MIDDFLFIIEKKLTAFYSNFFQNIYRKFHLVLNDVNSKSQVDKVDIVDFRYHGE